MKEVDWASAVFDRGDGGVGRDGDDVLESQLRGGACACVGQAESGNDADLRMDAGAGAEGVARCPGDCPLSTKLFTGVYPRGAATAVAGADAGADLAEDGLLAVTTGFADNSAAARVVAGNAENGALRNHGVPTSRTPREE